MTELARKPAGAGRADPFLRLVESVVSRHDAATGALGEERYRAFLDALGVAVYTTDATGGITMWATPRDGGGAEFGFASPLAPEATD